jgi:hypothetical protein
MKLRLLALLKNVKTWVFNLIFDNDLADREARLYFEDKNESN